MTKQPSPESNTNSVARLIYADTVRNRDLLYLSGLLTEDPFLWYSVNDCRKILVGDLEIGRARRVGPSGTEVMSFKQAGRQLGLENDGQSRKIVDYIVAISQHTGTRNWQVPADFPLKLADELEENGLTLQPVDQFCPERGCKSLLETKQIRIGVRLAEHGFYHAVAIIKQSKVNAEGNLLWHGEVLTAERLRGEIDAEIVRCGGLCNRTIVAPGRQAADPHEAGHGPIPAGQPLVLDIFPQVAVSGYHGDFTRTIVKGQASETVRQAFVAVKSARQAGLAAIHAGVAGQIPHEKAAETLSEHGFKTGDDQGVPYGFFHGLGHGLGLAIHESPSLNPHSCDVLQAGQVVTVEPGLYYPEWGGIRLEDVALVTKEGCENITMAPSFLELA